MQYEGKIIFIGDVETVWQHNLQKRTVVLEEVTEREYKWGIAFDLFKDKTSLIDEFHVGDIIKVSLNLRANYSEKTDRYYNSISAWRIEPVEGGPVDPQEEDLPF